MKKSGIGKGSVTQLFDTTPYTNNGLTKQEVIELKGAFQLLDVSGTGKLDANQLKNLVKAFCFGSKNNSLELAFEWLAGSKKSIDLATFLKAFATFFTKGNNKQNYSRLFKLFDDQKIGCISAKNLRRVVKQLDMRISEGQIQQMIERADVNNDGVVSEDQFCRIMTKMSAKV